MSVHVCRDVDTRERPVGIHPSAGRDWMANRVLNGTRAWAGAMSEKARKGMGSRGGLGEDQSRLRVPWTQTQICTWRFGPLESSGTTNCHGVEVTAHARSERRRRRRRHSTREEETERIG